MKPVEPAPVKLICGILFSDEKRLADALEVLAERYGRIDYRSALYPFTITGYYNREMGVPIQRLFVAFEPLISPGALAGIKIACNALEEALAVSGLRKVNLDPGYIDYDKLVLASAKYNAHKIYLDQGIYADPTLHFEKGAYLAAPWAFPDFKSGLYNADFLRIRARYKGQLRRQRAASE